MLSELAAQHVTVAIAGQGADELFAGYSRYRRAALVERSRSAAAAGGGSGGVRLGKAGGRYARFAGALSPATPPLATYPFARQIST
jgi:asparagine synthase (glutamine-hydrolysing)